MKRWNIKITKEAKKDFQQLDNSLKKQVAAGIIKVARAPLPSPHGYGKPLGNKNGKNLTGFFKIPHCIYPCTRRYHYEYRCNF